MKGQGGYTLFEVLIAFAVMAMVLAAILPRQAALLTRAQGLEARQAALDYALSRLDRLGVSDPAELGEMTETYRDWVVRQSVTGAELAGGAAAFRVQITVETRAGAHLAEISELRVIP